MLGKLLKNKRIKQRKKQEEICSGICSVSYYSKIENSKIIPAEDVLVKLMERLNLSRSDLKKMDHQEIKRNLLNWHIVIIKGNVKEALRMRTDLSEQIDYFQDQDLQLLYLLFDARLEVSNENINRLEKILEEISDFSLEETAEDIKFYYEKTLMSIYIFYEKYDKARVHACHASDYSETIVLPEEEMADMYVSIAKIALQVGDYSIAMDVAGRAIAVYDQQYNLEQSGACRVILAKAFRKVHKFPRAEKELAKAETIGLQTENRRLQAQVLQHRGELYAHMGKQMEAVHCFQQSYRMREGRDRLITIYKILQQFENIGSEQDILSWVEHGKETIADMRSSHGIIPYDERFEWIFRYYSLAYDKNETDHFEEEMKEFIIPFFTDLEDWKATASYTEKLAAYLEKEKRFDESVHWYKKSNEAFRRCLR
ncbi:MAG: XRE family transcriptional regulator [Alkalicoccus sp.]|nr:MAG: XRE family transcriptional regulator [Alkalicoccus sp.]